MVTWTALKAQFGIGTAAMFNFRSKFTATLGLATAVYPAARVEITEQGVVNQAVPAASRAYQADLQPCLPHVAAGFR